MNYSTLPHELTSAERTAIATELQRLEASASREQGDRGFELSLPGRPPLFIKRGDYDLYTEADTQVFFYKLAKNDGSTPRIPRVFDVFHTEQGDYFLVMEKVEAKTLDCCDISEEEAVQLAASAVQWLHDQLSSVPPTAFGRIPSSTSPPLHPFFKDHQAPRIFANANELASFVSQASQRCRASSSQLSTPDVLSLFGAHRQICHSDIQPSNFLLNSQGVWIIDFQHIAVLPEVFQTYGFFNIGLPFAAQVGIALKYHPSDKFNKMVSISDVIQAFGGSFLAKD